MARERGTRRTPAEQLASAHVRFGIGSPPPLTPVQIALAAEFPVDPNAEPEKARAAIAKAQAAGLNLGQGTKVLPPPK